MADVAKTLRNCFGSSDYPKTWGHEFIKSVRAYKNQRVSIDEFRKMQGIAQKKREALNGESAKGKKLWIYLFIAAVVLVILYWRFS